MKKTFIKTIVRDFKKNFTRLIAIVAIMALGVGFLIGLLSATPDLQESMESYYDTQQMYDILMKSSIGFRSEDVEELRKDIPEIEEIEGYSSIDYKIERDFTELTARVVTTSFSSKLHPIELIQGRLPENDKECVVHNMGIFLDEHPLEEEIVVEDTAYTIVGICNSPVYYYRMQETTQIGNGNLDVILYLDESYVSNLTITDISITVKGAKEYNSFKSSYFEYIAPVEEKLEEISEAYIQKRLMQLNPMGGLENPSFSLNPSDIQWYILNRKSNLSYVSFEVNSTKVNNVAVVFPFFFFFIAALIALTSVTRLIHEDRSSIGTLKSLGYSNLRILNKYFIYAAFACIVGSVCGLLLGVYGLPMVIYACYNSLFLMPKGIFGWHAWSVILSSVSMSSIVFIVMIAVCLSTLKEKPNALLVPKAPKAGRRILLERIGFIWKRLKFKYKSSIRNIFRFKKNLIMMIVGVGGCTGLMLVGLGLKDSLGAPAKDQFDTVLKYDFSLGIQEEVTLDFLQDSSYMYLYKEEGKVKKNLDYEVNILYADDTLLDFMKLDVKSLPEDSVIISSQLAQEFHLRKGSNLIIDVNGNEQSFKVNSIFTNYVDNYIITRKQDDRFNQMIVRLGEEDSKQYDSIVKEMYQSKDLLSVTDLTQTRKLYTSLSNGMDLVILLVIFCSGVLAIIVIYNLTNININERIKEIATLKVLGYQRKEVLGYIYREILMMSILGILFGFGLGPLLNLFVMKQISNPGQCFPTSLSGWNFLYSFLITLCFMEIVLLFFIPKMKKIKMVESLKSVE